MFPQLTELKISLLHTARKKEKIKQLPSFLKRISTLLNEGYTLTESINMLLPYHAENVEKWRDEIDEKLRKGSKVFELFQLFSIPQNYLIMIKIADELGTLSMTLENISAQMEFQEKMRKKLKNLLMYPIFLFLFLTCIFIAFRISFLPNIEQIFNTRSEYYQSHFTMTKLFLYIPDVLFIIVTFIFISTILFLSLFRKKTVEEKISLLYKIPIINYFCRLHITKTFSKSLGDLLIGGFSLQHALKILKEQQINLYISYIAEKIEQQIIFGETLSKAVFLTNLCFKKFEEFIEHGEKSSYLGRELIIYYELLEEKYQFIIKRAISIVQPSFFILIAICIVAAYLSILLPMYNLIEIV